jgi:ligand-binding sensor domain-containing protein/signal transduction histidine kinase
MLLSATELAGQTAELRFKHLNVEQGLSSNDVHSIVQDRSGFIWLATYSGLDRYDGNSIVQFRNDPRDSKSLSSNIVNTLLIDRSGSLWIGTRTAGLCRYDESTGNFITFRADPNNPNSLSNNSVHAILQDHSGKLWIGTEDGLDELDPETNTVTQFKANQQKSGALQNGYIISLCEDRYGILWVGTYMGLARFDPASKTFTTYIDKWSDPKALLNGTVSALFEDREGELWIGTMGGGLHRYDRATDSFQRYKLKKGPGTNINHLEDDFIRAIYEDHQGGFWIATQEGLVKFDRATQTAVFYNNDRSDAESISDNFILSLFEDRTYNLWCGTFSGGVNRLDLKQKQFVVFHHVEGDTASLSVDHVKSLYIDKGGVLWVGTWLGWLNKFDPITQSFKHYRGSTWDTTTLSSSIIYSMREDYKGRFWVGTAWGLNEMDQKTGRVRRWFPPYKKTPGNGGTDVFPYNIYSIEEDGAGYLWFATNNGLFRLDPEGGNWRRWTHNPADPGSVADDFIDLIKFDRQGELWIGTNSGLDRFNPQDSTFIHYKNDPANDQSLSSNEITDIHRSPDGTIWVGTSVGINRFDYDKGTFERFTEREGLGYNMVDRILEDTHGRLWVSTDRGISMFDPATKTFRNYTAGDGLQRDEFEQAVGAQDAGGRLYFGGIKGFTVFNPDSIRDNPFIPPVVLTSVHVSRNGSAIEKDFRGTNRLTFRHTENIITFDFSALEFTDPDRNQYVYRLQGFEDRWMKTGKLREATYTNLDPGDYVFQVKASNNDGKWNDAGVSLAFSVVPPWWETWWFRTVATILVVGLGFGAYKLRVRRLEREGELHREFAKQLIDNQEGERKRIAAELHDSIGQNLLVIKNRIFLGLQKRDKNDEMIKQFEMVSTTVSKTLEELRQISHNLRPYELDRLGLTDAIAAAIATITETTEINVDKELDTIDDIFPKDSETSIFRICQEIFNNIMKHSNAKRATVRVQKGDTGVFFYFHDNGEGFDIQRLRERKSKGRGMGLTGLEERVQILGGTINFSSHIGRGTTIQIAIPIRKNGGRA